MSGVDITFIVGLTGVGKSTTLAALRRSELTLLPNRRELTDAIIIPEMQRQARQPERPVTDRLARFDLTKRYRQRHPGGVVHALQTYLEETSSRAPSLLVFDNVRGAEEVKCAVETFSNARFIVLDAPNIVRLKRLVGRVDAFDQVAATRLENTSFIETLLAIRDANEVFDLHEIARLEAAGVDDGALLNAVRIIVAEQQNYDSGAALTYLRAALDDSRLLYLDTSEVPVDEVAARIERWL